MEIEDEIGKYVGVAQLEAATGLGDRPVKRALAALGRENPPFLEPIDASSLAGTYYMGAVNNTGHARRTVGAWPTPENLTDRSITA